MPSVAYTTLLDVTLLDSNISSDSLRAEWPHCSPRMHRDERTLQEDAIFDQLRISKYVACISDVLQDETLPLQATQCLLFFRRKGSWICVKRRCLTTIFIFFIHRREKFPLAWPTAMLPYDCGFAVKNTAKDLVPQNMFNKKDTLASIRKPWCDDTKSKGKLIPDAQKPLFKNMFSCKVLPPRSLLARSPSGFHQKSIGFTLPLNCPWAEFHAVMLRSCACSKAQVRDVELTAQAHAEESNVAMNAIAARLHLSHEKLALSHPILFYWLLHRYSITIIINIF